MISKARTLAFAVLATMGAAPAMAADGLHPLLGAAFTFGGETLATVTYSDGRTQDIKSGGLLHAYGGLEYDVGNFAVQANIGYHVDDTNARNGSITFSRVPVEVLAFWQVADHFRLGVGARKATSAKLSGSGVASNFGRTSFDSTVGGILQGEYLLVNDKLGIYGRYVSERYKQAGNGISGNHFGIGIAYRFF